MRKTPFILLVIMCAMLPCSCQVTKSDNLATARKVYEKYADRNDLTVALVGDYAVGEHGYTAVMLQAHDSSAWAWLRLEFGVVDASRFLPPLDSAIESSIAVRPSDANVVTTTRSIGSTTVTNLRDGMAVDVVLDQVVKSKLDSIGDLLGLEAGDIRFDVDFDTLVRCGGSRVVHVSNYNHDTLVSESVAVDSLPVPMSSIKDAVQPHGDLLRMVDAEGHCGYHITVDYASRTLWLFFFSSHEELDDIRSCIKTLLVD